MKIKMVCGSLLRTAGPGSMLMLMAATASATNPGDKITYQTCGPGAGGYSYNVSTTYVWSTITLGGQSYGWVLYSSSSIRVTSCNNLA